MRSSPTLHWLQARHAQGTRTLALLLDPDKANAAELPTRLARAQAQGVGLVLVGGSLLTQNRTRVIVAAAKAATNLPVVLFPGSAYQLCPEADAVLFLSLISGRNPELLIGQHVHAAPLVLELGLEAIATGYMLVDCGRATSASYMSGTLPIPHDKPDIAAATALAGQMLGLRLIYTDGGSGAKQPIHPEMLAAVRGVIQVPLVVGGGIRTPEQAAQAWHAGADVVVVGTALEAPGNETLLREMADAVPMRP